jgi:hypothetical protein
MKRRCFALLAFVVLFGALAVRPVRGIEDTPPSAASDWVELHRIRVVNHKDGAVQVSTDGGKTWLLLGRVLIPATTVAEGYLAANYADPGTVSAAAVHGLRIRTGGQDKTLHAPMLLSINPREYAGEVNKGFGGMVAGSAGIYTNIPAGASIFRNLAPLVGNPVFTEGANGRLFPLPETFRPKGQGEALVIVVRRPANPPVELTFANKVGGKVGARYADGTTREITQVVQPVRGVGRFDGTAYTGVGRINTAHTGVITVSTAPVDAAQPEGVGRERRGGFQISPAWHNARTHEAGAPMMLIVGTPGERKRDLEGTPPLFRDAVPLSWADGGDARSSAIAEVSIDDGPWEPMPAVVGARLDAFTGPGLTRLWKSQGKSRTASRGVMAIRLRLPVLTPEHSKTLAAAASGAYRASRLAAARAGQVPIVKGILTVNANPDNQTGVSFVRLSVDGSPRGFTNRAPFQLSWDTTRVPDGEYLVEAEALDSAGAVLATNRRRVFVLNNPSPTPVQAAGGK